VTFKISATIYPLGKIYFKQLIKNSIFNLYFYFCTNMLYIFIYIALIFVIELMVFYTPLYYISYGVFNLDDKIKDSKLVFILILFTVILSIIFFPFFDRIVQIILF